jgi:hypothetical protein
LLGGIVGNKVNSLGLKTWLEAKYFIIEKYAHLGIRVSRGENIRRRKFEKKENLLPRRNRIFGENTYALP